MVKVSNKLAAGRKRNSGFTLAEVLIASLIVGMCLTAGMVAISSTTELTSDSNQFTKATLLAQEVREWSLNTDFADITDLDLTNVAPRDSLGAALSGYGGWTETIDVTYRDPDNITVVSGSATDVVKIDLTIMYNSNTVLVTSWLVVYDQP